MIFELYQMAHTETSHFILTKDIQHVLY